MYGVVMGLSLWFISHNEGSIQLSESDKLAEVIELLGGDYSEKRPDYSIPFVSATVGKALVHDGIAAIPGSKKAKRQSKHFVCTSCHNTTIEDPDLANPNPQSRLIYAKENGIPFLQATTLYGAVNRETYYNGDYEKKYGDLVLPARYNIREAIQLCATECSQGRKLEKWELESVLAYLWELQLTVGDVELSELEKESIELAVDNERIRSEALKLIKTKYALASPATALPPPEDRKKGTGLDGDPENGALIYELSCMHCHYQKKYSFLHLDKTKMNLKHLDRKAGTYDRHSIYQVVRYGTFPKHGKKSYMPFYTKEKMSEQQLSDLRAYLAEGAEGFQ